MSIFLLLRQMVSSVLARFSWAALGLAVFAHFIITYIGLVLAGEQHLIEPVTFFYYYITTAMTVGYGDLAPQSAAGRVFVAIWLMVGGIALLTTVIGKTTNTIIELWRHQMKGKGSFEKHTDHTVLIGWEGASSEEIVNLLKLDETSNDNLIVICASSIEENPMPGHASFIRGETLTSPAVLARAGVATAERVLIRTGSDDQTLAAVLAVHQLQPLGHVVAHFSDTHKANLARSYAPGLECTSSMAVEMLVRSSQDPGSSVVINELLTVGEGATQYRATLATDYEGTFGELFNALKQKYNATVIAYKGPGDSAVIVNPPFEQPVRGGEFYYIANKRMAGDF
ncbi:voltage-gated potassium channel [Pseudomonas cuatrocienegasensis]|uniref:Voltage-gated potassium channel n=1 Tax=Pseudomonas cuatrocienegasensis TaxID=543360 RepID=A0ABY1BRM8_9PSED|nr:MULTISPECIES: ion channel [Pseudomonas]OEC32611.1 potassium channel protein [Pseudomonas sp. 21C1]SER46460.1 voltage-gated potassium channel [Pseudomonas cuatrocienegasensis]